MELLQKVRILNHMKRCCMYPCIHKTSVAEHSYHVALLSLFVGEELIAKGVNVNIEKVMSLALIHDLDEAVTSDLPYPVKNHVKKAIKEYIDDKFDNELNHMTPAWLKTRFNGMNCKEFEYRIVKACDMAELLMYCIDEMELGNRKVRDMAETACRVLIDLNMEIQSNHLNNIVTKFDIIR